MSKILSIMSRIFYVIFLLSVLGACATKPEYTPPSNQHLAFDDEIIVNATYDEAWDRIISSMAKTTFGIENFEKDSGLITFKFTASNAADYITGGDIKIQSTSYDWINYTQIHWGGTLSGTVNVSLKPIPSTDGAKNLIRVSVRQVYSMIDRPYNPYILSSGTSKSFILGPQQCDTKIFSAYPDPGTISRTVCSKNTAVKDFIDQLLAEFSS